MLPRALRRTNVFTARKAIHVPCCGLKVPASELRVGQTVEHDGKKMNVVATGPVTAHDVELCDATTGEVFPILLRSTDEVVCMDPDAPGTDAVEVNEDLHSAQQKRSFTVEEMYEELMASTDFKATLKELIHRGADIHAIDENGDNVLQLMHRDHIILVDENYDILAEAGIDFTHRNNDGMDAVDLLVEYPHGSLIGWIERGLVDIGSNGKLHPAIRKCTCLTNHPKVLEWVKKNNVPKHLASCNDDYGVSTAKGSFKSYKYIVGYGRWGIGDHCPYVREKDGRTVMMDTCYSGYIDSVTNAEQYMGRNNYRDVDGRTNMHYAVTGGSPEVVQYLVDEDYEYNTADHSGQTPLELARELHAKSAKDPRNNVRKTPRWPAECGDDREETFQIMLQAIEYEKSYGDIKFTIKATTDDYAEVVKILENAIENIE